MCGGGAQACAAQVFTSVGGRAEVHPQAVTPGDVVLTSTGLFLGRPRTQWEPEPEWAGMRRGVGVLLSVQPHAPARPESQSLGWGPLSDGIRENVLPELQPFCLPQDITLSPIQYRNSPG